MGILRRFAIRLFTPLSWGASRQRLADGMHRFSQVEADSAWQLLQVLDATESPRARAGLFANALEEVQHASLFAQLARDYAQAPLPLSAPRRRQLYRPERGMAEFTAYHFVSEREVYQQFYAYAAASRDPRVRQTFLDIRGDEDDHHQHAWQQLVTLARTPRAARRLALRARLSRLYDAWLRLGKRIGGVTSSLILGLLYLVTAPLVGRACRRRIAAAEWESTASPLSLPAAEAAHGRD